MSCWVALDAAARSGLIETLDGHLWEGQVRLTADNVVVASAAATNTIPFTNLLRLKFDVTASSLANGTGRGNGLLGYYFGNTNLEGSVFVRLDESINFDWGLNEPAPGIGKDFFGVIWMGEVEAPATGEFTFSIGADDGGRLYIGDTIVVDSSQQREASEMAGQPIPLQAGKRYPLKFMYFDFFGNARARLSWIGPNISREIIPKERLYAKSRLPSHQAAITNSQGLLATYYKLSDFSGETYTRVDPTIDFNWVGTDPAPGIARSSFAVRWMGQVKAEFSEAYTFYVVTDEPARLWFDDKLLIVPSADFFPSESKETVSLVAGEKYEVRLETQSTSAGAMARLMWSSASTPRTVIPAANLFPSKPTAVRNQPPEVGEKMPPGLLLRNGVFVGFPVEKATGTSIKVGGLLKNNPISTVNVARILCQPLSEGMANRIVPGRTGLLLTKGDFVDAEFRSMEGDRVEVSSILFGLRTYDAKKEVLAIVLRDPNPNPMPFEIQLRDKSILRVSLVGIEPDALILQDTALGRMKIAAQELDQIKRRRSMIEPGTGKL